MYKNGGVGALGHMGTQETALRAERWAWLTITRKKGALRTYLNGRLCAEVPLAPVAAASPAGAAGGKAGDGGKAGRDESESSGDDGEGSDTEGELSKRKASKKASAKGKASRARERDALLRERFCLTPEHFALFATAAEHSAAADGASEVAPDIERGLALKYVRVVGECWDEATVADELHKLRSVDEDADLVAQVTGPNPL